MALPARVLASPNLRIQESFPSILEDVECAPGMVRVLLSPHRERLVERRSEVHAIRQYQMIDRHCERCERAKVKHMKSGDIR
jgi:hypothetical protein